MTGLPKLSALAVATAVMLGAATSTARAVDASEQPLIMSLQTGIYNISGPDNSFTIYFGSTQADTEIFVKGPKTQEYVWVDPYSIGSDADGGGTTVATPVGLSVTASDNTIEIYGDPAKIDFIDIHGIYATSVTFSDDLVNLGYLDVSRNTLTKIDLSKLTSLYWLDLQDNEFSVPANMKIGTNHPGLAIMFVGMNDVIDPEFDLKNFPELQYFSAYSNPGITSIDPTGCPKLVSLQLDATNISSIDVSQNEYLDILNLSQTKVTNIDLSKNWRIGELYINHDGSMNNTYKMTSIDLSNNKNLEYLDLGGNSLTEIDLSGMKYLKMLYLMRNQFTTLDLSGCPGLVNVDISNNYLNFATLPLPGSGFENNYFYNQRPLRFPLKVKVGDPIDLSDQVIRAPYVDSNGTTINPETYAAVFVTPRLGDVQQLDESAYTFKDGVLTFNQAVADSVYVAFHCTAFDEYDLTTTSFKVKTPEEFDLPSTAFTFTPDASMAGKNISFSLGARVNAAGYSLPADVTILVGGEKIVLEDVVTSAGLPSSPNVTFTMPAETSQVTVALDDEFVATALAMDGVALTNIDLSLAELLTTLNVTNAGLKNINLGYNNNLVSIGLSGNSLTNLELQGVRGDYEKWNLRSVDVSDNKLTRLTATSYETITSLNLANNNFKTFDAKYYTGLTSLDLSGNGLTGELDLTKSTALRTLNLANNSLTAVLVDSWRGISQLNLANNSLTFATLPVMGSGVNYSYAPQNKYQILAVAPAINLSSLNIDGATNYVWKYSSDNTVVDNSLISNDGGAFKFDETLLDKTIYCEMTNPAFPDFDNQPLTTTGTTVAQVPTVLVASFTTPQAKEGIIGFRFNNQGENAVYIDWRGDGTEYEPYIYEANGTGGIYRKAMTVAGATAKVYSYTSAQDISVFAMDSIPLTMFNGEPMTRLQALDLHSTGLQDGQITLPSGNTITELVLDGAKFQNQTFTGHNAIRSLNLAGSQYESFDLSLYPNVTFAQLADNNISSIKFGNNKALYQLDVQGNNLDAIDLTGLTGLEELLISNNNLTEINLDPVRENLRALVIAGNRMTFATLPLPSEMGDYFYVYDYFNQQPMEVEADGDKIDLSSQAEVAGTPTTFRWFLGDRQSDVYFDYYYEEFMGEELEGPDASSDPEFVVENGVTTFLYPQSRKVICAMTNDELPSLILYTRPTAIDVSAVESIFAAEDGSVDVYNLNGVLVKHSDSLQDALQGLAPGIYIVGGHKVLVK